MNTIVSFGAVLVAVVIGFTVTYSSDSTATLAWAVGAVIAVAVIVPLALLPGLQDVVVGHRPGHAPLEPDDGVDPRWLPPAARHEQP